VAFVSNFASTWPFSMFAYTATAAQALEQRAPHHERLVELHTLLHDVCQSCLGELKDREGRWADHSSAFLATDSPACLPALFPAPYPSSRISWAYPQLAEKLRNTGDPENPIATGKIEVAHPQGKSRERERERREDASRLAERSSYGRFVMRADR